MTWISRKPGEICRSTGKIFGPKMIVPAHRGDTFPTDPKRENYGLCRKPPAPAALTRRFVAHLSVCRR